MEADEKKPLLHVGGASGDATPTAPPIEPPPYEEPSVPGTVNTLNILCDLTIHVCMQLPMVLLLVQACLHPMHLLLRE